VRAQVWTVRALNHPDVRALTTYLRMERIRLGVDRLDDLLACPFPSAAAWSTQMSYPLVRVVARFLVYACNDDIGHFCVPLG
jgi:hypothetical protein